VRAVRAEVQDLIRGRVPGVRPGLALGELGKRLIEFFSPLGRELRGLGRVGRRCGRACRGGQTARWEHDRDCYGYQGRKQNTSRTVHYVFSLRRAAITSTARAVYRGMTR
jgi:hypothetical protein